MKARVSHDRKVLYRRFYRWAYRQARLYKRDPAPFAPDMGEFMSMMHAIGDSPIRATIVHNARDRADGDR